MQLLYKKCKEYKATQLCHKIAQQMLSENYIKIALAVELYQHVDAVAAFCFLLPSAACLLGSVLLSRAPDN